MMTGYYERSSMTITRDAGVTEFLTKPISTKDLYLRINTCIVNPRQFFRTQSFLGPDRRRFTFPNYSGELLRKADMQAIEEREKKAAEEERAGGQA